MCECREVYSEKKITKGLYPRETLRGIIKPYYKWGMLCKIVLEVDTTGKVLLGVHATYGMPYIS